MAMRSRAVASENLWRRVGQLSFDDAEQGKQALADLKALVQTASEDGFVISGLQDIGLQALRLSQKSDIPPDRELNETARDAFTQILERYPQRAVAVGLAHSGLATVEENLFVLTGDSQHKVRAAEHLNKIIDNALLNGMPFQRLAIDRRNALDTTFTDVRFVMNDPADGAAPSSELPSIGDDGFNQLPLELQKRIGSAEEFKKVLQGSNDPIILDPAEADPQEDETDDEAPQDSDTP
jgi:hypothetical protein